MSDSEKSPELKFATYIYYVISYLFVTGMFERSLEKNVFLDGRNQAETGRHGSQTGRTPPRKKDGADASGRRKVELPGELKWPLQTPEDVERLEEISSRDEGKRKAMVSCWKFLKDAVTKYMHVTEMGRGVF